MGKSIHTCNGFKKHDISYAVSYKLKTHFCSINNCRKINCCFTVVLQPTQPSGHTPCRSVPGVGRSDSVAQVLSWHREPYANCPTTLKMELRGNPPCRHPASQRPSQRWRLPQGGEDYHSLMSATSDLINNSYNCWTVWFLADPVHKIEIIFLMKFGLMVTLLFIKYNDLHFTVFYSCYVTGTTLTTDM